jgi:hypothetical protein
LEPCGSRKTQTTKKLIAAPIQRDFFSPSKLLANWRGSKTLSTFSDETLKTDVGDGGLSGEAPVCRKDAIKQRNWLMIKSAGWIETLD